MHFQPILSARQKEKEINSPIFSVRATSRSRVVLKAYGRHVTPLPVSSSPSPQKTASPRRALAMVEPTVRDVLAFHRVDRAAYDQLLSLGVPPPPARNAVALLMWLGRRGGGAGVDAVDRARRLVRTRHDAARLASEARAVLHGGAAALDLARRWAGAGETLISSVLGGGGVDVRRFFALVPDDAPRRGVAEVLDGVGALVFDDRLYALLRRHEEGGGAVLPAELAAPYRRPLAPALAPVGDGGCRSLFITFSKGSPLTREEIEEYFTEYVAQSPFLNALGN